MKAIEQIELISICIYLIELIYKE